MRHIGHTMATPKRSINDAISLFAELGFDGTEVISRTLSECGSRHGEAAGEARIFSHEWDASQIAEVTSNAVSSGVPFVTVTQYVKAINSTSEDERSSAISQIAAYIDFAALIGAKFVRVYGGADGFGADSWHHAVASLKTLGETAGAAGILLLIENHPGTLTVTGRQTAEMVEKVGLSSVRALYDPANVLCHSDEKWEDTFDIQKDIISYVHVKDFLMKSGERIACPVGDGDVPWKQIIERLVKSGYDGCLSYEYEKKWNPEQLPDARIGLAQSLTCIRSFLE